jgi:two-component system, NtrC family, sensor histidine kinase HydH
MCFIDPVHLQQILWNLIKNAAQAIPGKGKIVITLTSPRNNRIYLTIKDNGQGIDPKKARHIFDPFFTTKAEGTGLGLSIIHRLIETYDGMIDFDSIPGKGTVFTIIFKPADPVEKQQILDNPLPNRLFNYVLSNGTF